MTTTLQITEKMVLFFNQKGYPQEEETGLVTSVFPGMFNPSAAHWQVMEMIGKEGPLRVARKFFVIEQCIRHVDFDKIGQSHHSAFFQMAAFVHGIAQSQISKKEIITISYELLTQALHLDPSRLLITVFGGGKVKNLSFEPDHESYNILRELGISDERLLYVSGENNLVYLQREGDAAGERCEIYYDRGSEYPINRYVEIGSIIFESYRFSKGQLVPTKNIVAGGAFGIERLEMVLNGFPTIYHGDGFAPLVGIVQERFSDPRTGIIFAKDVYSAIDCLKAVVFILNSGQQPDDSKRGEILKKLIKRAVSCLQSLGIYDREIYQELVDKTIEAYRSQYANLYVNRARILGFIEERAKKV